MKCRCPNCQSDRVVTKDYARSAGCALGTLAGAVGGATAAASGAEIGMLAGAVAGPLGAIAGGGMAGAIVGALLVVSRAVRPVRHWAKLWMRKSSTISYAWCANSASAGRMANL